MALIEDLTHKSKPAGFLSWHCGVKDKDLVPHFIFDPPTISNTIGARQVVNYISSTRVFLVSNKRDFLLAIYQYLSGYTTVVKYPKLHLPILINQ